MKVDSGRSPQTRVGHTKANDVDNWDSGEALKREVSTPYTNDILLNLVPVEEALNARKGDINITKYVQIRLT